MLVYAKKVWNRWATPVLCLAMMALVAWFLGTNALSLLETQSEKPSVAAAPAEVTLTSYVTNDNLCRGLSAKGDAAALAAYNQVLRCP